MAATSDWTVPPPPYARWLNEAFPNVKSPPPRRYRLPFKVLPGRAPRGEHAGRQPGAGAEPHEGRRGGE